MTEPTKKTADMKTYMRDYMNNRYKENHEKEKCIRLAYYYKKQYGLEQSQIQKYGEHLPLIIKANKVIQQIKNKCPELLSELEL
jgi:hypothetical protein